MIAQILAALGRLVPAVLGLLALGWLRRRISGGSSPEVSGSPAGASASRVAGSSGGAPAPTPSRDRRSSHRRRPLARWALRAAGLGAVLGVAGIVVVVSGVVPIKASSGHWPITVWFLQFAKGRSVATHSLPLDAPQLDVPALVVKGAGHFDFGCRPCHGSPDLRQPRIAWRMTPLPPDLASTVVKYDDEALFYIVKHGIKFTGMPAWPVPDRDDEVWAMVAFLRLLPELEPDAYRRLARGETSPEVEDTSSQTIDDLVPPAEPPFAVVESCARCHGLDGGGTHGSGAFPRIDGQRREYLYAALRAYADKRRPSGVMGPIAGGLDATAWAELADYYAARVDAAARQAVASAAAANPDVAAARERGEAIASQGVPVRDVPACRECHGPVERSRNPVYPDLAGQYANYLELQLRLFQEGRRGGSPYAHLMLKVAPRLTAEEMRDVALYYASLAPPGSARPAPAPSRPSAAPDVTAASPAGG